MEGRPRILIAVVSTITVAAVVVGVALGLPDFGAPVASRRDASVDAEVTVDVAPAVEATPPAAPSVVILGGGPPEGTQVSLEQDVMLALLTLRSQSPLLLFGGGAGTPVMVLEEGANSPQTELEALRRDLADLFDPRASRDATFRPTMLAVHGPASPERVVDALRDAMTRTGPLLVIAATHGAPGETPAGSELALWGGAIDTHALADVLDAPSERQVRLVLASCFSGGFAELVFTGANAEGEVTESDRCGLFASTWDLEASGCDPDPDRAAQEGYLIHFLSALRGQRRDGADLERDVADLDGNGEISLLEAHTCARIAARSLDVPTSTSERYLRHVSEHPSRTRGPATDPVPLVVEEEAVIAALGSELQASTEEAAVAKLDALENEIAQGDAAVTTFDTIEQERFEALRLALAKRFPTLDDPWREGHAALVEQNGAAIAEILDRTEEGGAFREAHAALEEASRAFEGLELRRARLLRLVRAYETRRLARALAARGGPDLARYQRFLACERSR